MCSNTPWNGAWNSVWNTALNPALPGAARPVSDGWCLCAATCAYGEPRPGARAVVLARRGAHYRVRFSGKSFLRIFEFWNSVFDTFSSHVEAVIMLSRLFWNTPDRSFM